MLNHTNSSPPLPNDGRGGQIPEYAAMTAFAKAHKGITYERFDSHLVRDLNLFAIKEDLDFEKLEETLDRMIKELPTLKRILAKPIIRLTDSDEVLPVADYNADGKVNVKDATAIQKKIAGLI